MKNKIFIALAALALVCSCQIDVDKTELSSPAAYSVPVLEDMADIFIDNNNSNEQVTFLWSEASFGVPVQILYSLYATYEDKTALLGTSFTNSLTLTKSDINGIAVNSLGIKANDAADISAYLEAKVANTTLESIKSSNTVSFNVQTFKAKLNFIYICGQFQNGWDVANAPQFWETGGGTKTYKVLIDYLAGGTITPGQDQGFKILTQRAWAGDYWGYDGLTPAWNCPENGDKNFQFGDSAKEIYQITVNLNDKTIKADGYSAISLIGSFDESAEWKKDVDLVYDFAQNIWTGGPITFSSGNDFLIRFNHAWDKKLGTATKASDDVENGYELVEGGDNMKVPEAGTYIMKIHGNRTPMVIVMEKQD